ncbi:hypothetical protein [Pseudoxanthomonas wuyuanensis]
MASRSWPETCDRTGACQRGSAWKHHRLVAPIPFDFEWQDVFQHAITAYESGLRRVPISTLPPLADTFGATVEELIGILTKRGAGKRGPAPKLQLERICQFPKAGSP